jgi:hypothetical protein
MVAVLSFIASAVPIITGALSVILRLKPASQVLKVIELLQLDMIFDANKVYGIAKTILELAKGVGLGGAQPTQSRISAEYAKHKNKRGGYITSGRRTTARRAPKRRPSAPRAPIRGRGQIKL